jgi:hypothetical protein
MSEVMASAVCTGLPHTFITQSTLLILLTFRMHEGVCSWIFKVLRQYAEYVQQKAERNRLLQRKALHRTATTLPSLPWKIIHQVRELIRRILLRNEVVKPCWK